ncbi:putative pentatricopeptide repeat-containing protein-like [Capsicum annuum]|uniref:uncharacterized protein LOC107866127 isoform X1 n=1 Tax=Capsicum annuum TaxID=4072 RepID=UPI0007BED3A1|nr:uncharacterized protein LOC107866127 isoform X1 [Capsicum annuum]KAF3680978.1 putative pentatricopeptide repeat-containing protein-like [Capsicum annuum]KAF3683065.1 putative pentatricopeptide repeat-containing protein-like [Capsicum annuum]
MVKLASAREIRMYGPRLNRNRFEYINAGVYMFAAILLVGGFAAQFSKEQLSGLVLLFIGLAVIMVVNVHDLLAHLAGIDYRFLLLGFDPQLALVEFAVPVVHSLGTLLYFLGILFLFTQAEKGHDNFKVEKQAVNLLIAGPALWLIGSIHNSCQIYERADGHVQILQQSVNIPFLLGSLLFLVGAILNWQKQSGYVHHGLKLLSDDWKWFGVFGSLLLLIGGLMNVVKVFKMQQMSGLRLEKLRGGAQDRLMQEREGQMPLIIEEQRRRRNLPEEGTTSTTVAPTPYKDVLVGQA